MHTKPFQPYVKVGKTYKCLVFPTNLGNNSLNFFFGKNK
jgi:hypothetical protein